MDLLVWKNQQLSRCPFAHYSHFDCKVSFATKWDYITVPEKIVHHGFYPLIHNTLKQPKIKNGHLIDYKIREIYYASHIDRLIYKYYAFLLNEQYNDILSQRNLSDVVIAYRTNLGKNNIHFSHHAFSLIKRLQSCYVIIGDFTNFFDNLEHNYLKLQICNVLSLEKLPPDYFHVFKSITQFSYVDIKDILEITGITSLSKLNKCRRVMTTEQLHNNRQYIAHNSNSFGIPQGTPIRAVFANIYMLDADDKIHNLVKAVNGLYMRYSDDFIIIIPQLNIKFFNEIYDNLYNIINNIPRVELSPDKVQLYHVLDGEINDIRPSIDITQRRKIISFLGFSYDGTKISIRAKTISRYYHKVYRKIRTINRHKMFKSNQRVNCHNLYNKYTIKHHHDNNQTNRYGNFIDYAIKSTKCFGCDESVNLVIKRHLEKIRKRLKSMKT